MTVTILRHLSPWLPWCCSPRCLSQDMTEREHGAPPEWEHTWMSNLKIFLFPWKCGVSFRWIRRICEGLHLVCAQMLQSWLLDGLQIALSFISEKPWMTVWAMRWAGVKMTFWETIQCHNFNSIWKFTLKLNAAPYWAFIPAVKPTTHV